MTRKFAKDTRKFRGERRYGYGKIHRHSGQRGGVGLYTGRLKQMRSRFTKQQALGFPDPKWEIGKNGFKVPPEIARRKAVNAINLKKLEELVDAWVAEGKAQKNGATYVINLDSLNYQKLIGRGSVTKKLEITVQSASEGVQEKLKDAKCKLTLLKADSEE